MKQLSLTHYALCLCFAESFFPTKERQFGQIQSAHNYDCVQKPSSGRNPTGKLITGKCAIEVYGPQMFVMPSSDESGYWMTDESVCLDVNSSTEHSAALLVACAEFDRQRWIYHSSSQQIVHVKSKLCLTLDKRGAFMSIRKCKDTNPRQRWNILTKEWTTNQ